MTTYVDAAINDRWPIVLPDFRRDFHAARPKWEAGRLESCAELMGPGMTVWDIGAEHGDFTALYGLWVTDGGTVVPIEPAYHYWPFIRGTWEANRLPAPIPTFEGLAGDVDHGSNGLRVGWPESASGEGVPDGGFIHLAQDEAHERATIDHLDAWAPFPPDAIVMDIEGAEWHALSGAARVLREHRPLVWVSVHEPTMLDWYHRTLGDLHELMHVAGYAGEELPHHGEGETFWLYRPS